MNPRARAPKAPTKPTPGIRSTIDAADDAKLEAVVAQARAALVENVKHRDGRFSLSLAQWRTEMERVLAPIVDAELAAAAEVRALGGVA